MKSFWGNLHLRKRMTRLRKRVLNSALLMILVLNLFPSGSYQWVNAHNDHPNIIFIYDDQQRACSLPWTQNGLVAPNLTKMKNEGVWCPNSISNNPICMPYRGMLMSGCWPYNTANGITNNAYGNAMLVNSNTITLGKVFQNAGYYTGYIGKWHVSDDTRAESYGFDYSMIWTGTATHYGGKYYPADHPQGINNTAQGSLAMTGQALDFIDAHYADTNPFFLMVSLNPPHYPYRDSTQASKNYYNTNNLPYRANALNPDWEDYQGYHAHITDNDNQLQRIFEKLSQHSLNNKTIVIFTSDHGDLLYSHDLERKQWPYEESINTPFLVWGPGHIKAGVTDEVLIGAVDVFPTLCGLANISAPSTCDGKNLADHFLLNHTPNTANDPKAQLIMSLEHSYEFTTDKYRGIRTRRYTYVVKVEGEPYEWYLFDNQTYPLQYASQNLINHPDLFAPNDPDLAAIYHTPSYTLDNLKEELRRQLWMSLYRAHDEYADDEIWPASLLGPIQTDWKTEVGWLPKLKFNTTEDASVHQLYPTTPYPTAPLVIGNGPITGPAIPYLKFTVSDVSGTIKSAVLKIYSADVQGITELYEVPDITWSETGITWNNKPALGRYLCRKSCGDDVTGSSRWISWDVTNYITGNGDYSFALKNYNAVDDMNFRCKESKHGCCPRLEVIYDSSVTPTPTPTPSLDGNLKGYWRFDEPTGIIAHDSTNNGKDGIVYGASWITNGKSNGALDFNGVDSYVSLPFILDPGKTNFTAVAWVKLAGAAGNKSQTILAQEDTTPTPTTTGKNWIYRSSTDGKLGTNLAVTPAFSNGTIDVESWYQVAVVNSSGTVQLFINGEPDGSTTYTINSATGRMLVGRFKNPSSDAEEWYGQIDQVRIYDRALCPGEIWNLYLSGE